MGVEPVHGAQIERCPAHAAQHLHLPPIGAVDQQRHLAADREGPVVGHRQGQQGGRGGIGGVAVLSEYLHTRCHGSRLTGRHSASLATGLPTDVRRRGERRGCRQR